MFATREFLKLARGAALGVAAALLFVTPSLPQTDPLPSWNDTAPKAAIVGFVWTIPSKIASPPFGVSKPDLTSRLPFSVER